MREKVCKLTKVTLFHCYETRLKLIKLYNMVNSLSVLKILPYFSNTTYLTCHHHPLHFEFPFSKTDKYKFCNFTRTICDWNNLTIDSIESRDQMWLTVSGKTSLIIHLQVLRNVGFKYSRCCSLPMVVATHSYQIFTCFTTMYYLPDPPLKK